MTSDRMSEVRLWRDVQLFRWYGDESAASRLREHGSINESVRAVDAMAAPTSDELGWTDVTGDPLDPSHPWWGYQGPSAVELRAQRAGLPWPPEIDPDPYSQS